MAKEGAMHYGDILMLWGVIFSMMGILSIIQMGIMDGFMEFVITGIVFVVIGVVIFVILILVDKKKFRKTDQ
jgi:hypothetical protein